MAQVIIYNPRFVVGGRLDAQVAGWTLSSLLYERTWILLPLLESSRLL